MSTDDFTVTGEELDLCLDRAEAAEAATLRLAQALRVIRDTTSGYAALVAGRALNDAGVEDPPEPSELIGDACRERAEWLSSGQPVADLVAALKEQRG